MKICPLLLFALIVFTPAFAQPVDLRLNLTTGETYRQTTKSSVVINQVLEGTPFDMTMNVDGTIAFRVESKEGRNYLVSVQYEYLSLGMNTDGQVNVYTSEQIDTNDIVSLLLGEMKNNPFQLLMSDKGRVLEVIGISNWIEPALSKMSRFSEELVIQVIEQVQKTYGEESVKSNIELATAIFPEKPVSKGDTWSTNTELNSTMKAAIVTQYTLSKLTKKTAKLEGKSTIITDPDAPPMESPAATIQYNLKGNMHSTIELDPVTGWITASTFTQQLEGENIITPSMAGMGPMKVPMKLKSETVISGN